MPPSTNKLYFKSPRGLVLTKTARLYREHVKKEFAKRMAELSVFPAQDPEICYEVDLKIYMKNLENPGWFKFYTKTTYYTKDERGKNGKLLHQAGDVKNQKGDRKAKTRYKIVDVDNRVKFVQDCTMRSLGVPGDEQVFKNTQSKIQTKDKERVEVTVWVADHDQFFPEE